jgi:hypothetical protein
MHLFANFLGLGMIEWIILGVLGFLLFGGLLLRMIHR